MRVPLEVGQIRDIANGAERRAKVQRLARVLAFRLREGGTPLDAEIAALDGSRRRHKNPADLERCPVVDEQGRAAGDERPKPLVTEDAHDLRKRAANAEAEVAHLREREAHFAKALGVANRGQPCAEWDGAIQRVIDGRYNLRLRVTALEEAILSADGPHKRDCSRSGLNFTAKCSCGLDALMGRTV